MTIITRDLLLARGFKEVINVDGHIIYVHKLRNGENIVLAHNTCWHICTDAFGSLMTDYSVEDWESVLRALEESNNELL